MVHRMIGNFTIIWILLHDCTCMMLIQGVHGRPRQHVAHDAYYVFKKKSSILDHKIMFPKKNKWNGFLSFFKLFEIKGDNLFMCTLWFKNSAFIISCRITQVCYSLDYTLQWNFISKWCMLVLFYMYLPNYVFSLYKLCKTSSFRTTRKYLFCFFNSLAGVCERLDIDRRCTYS